MKKLFLILFILSNISLVVAQDTWESVSEKYNMKIDFLKKNCETPEEVKNWFDAGVQHLSNIPRLKKIGIKTPKEFKPYSKLGIKDMFRRIKGQMHHIEILKSLKMKPNTLILSMSEKGVGFKSKKDFLSTYKLLRKNKCKKIEPNFNNADEYDNKGKCYLFGAKMFQRLDKTHGLAFNYDEWSLQEGNLFFAIFNKSWRDGKFKSGLIKGLGNFKYQTSSGSMKNVPKGKVIKFRN